jgi:hypothetical protein
VEYTVRKTKERERSPTISINRRLIHLVIKIQRKKLKFSENIVSSWLSKPLCFALCLLWRL